MTTWDKFFPLVRLTVQGCPTNIVEAAIKSACAEFCSKSLIWNQNIICGTLVKNVRNYKFNDTDTSIVMPLAVHIKVTKDDGSGDYDIVPLLKTNIQDLDTFNPKWRELVDDVPKSYFMSDSNTFTIVEKPKDDSDDTLVAFCAVKPKSSCTGVPDFLLEDWGEGIAAGALMKLHAMQGRSWADPTMVAYHTRKFRAEISRAKSKMYKSYIAQSKTMLPVAFGGI